MPVSRHTSRYKRFQRMLKNARKGRGLTQAQVAKRLGRPQSYVAKYENGERRLDLIEFLDVANVLELQPGAFLRRLMQADG
jgi:transcriptional regulator with XRE-family HTH domain